MADGPRVTPWPGAVPATEDELLGLYAAERLSPYQWSNAPGDTYAAHSLSYDKIIYVVRGSITFGLPDTAQQMLLRSGDRLDLPAGVRHDATVGPDGVVCLEAHR